ncbi:MAG: sigma-54 dependent transcriptional regulator [Dechloromonas sp.]|nr:sigma-54 dependent transcriptional regulator [Dechloromonas sp.]
MNRVLTFPDSQSHPLSIRAKALVFNDPASLDILNTTELIAPSEATVLIIGDTGTGKELIARHVHQQSGRNGPFVAVNCGAFSENLIEAELFGHEAGAFTGAQGSRAGWFEAAQHGTLFLDEIGDLPLAMQVKLLRVLQERQVVRLGSRRPIDIDVRLVAATNVDLVSAVEAGHFRADLFYRLNIATIQLPPLRERPGDILPLARHFVDSYRARLHLGPIEFSSNARQALVAYSWPGNIRELENVIHYALIVCRDGVIRSADLRLNERVPVLGGTRPAADEEDDECRLSRALREMFDENRDHLFEQVEETLVRLAFEHCDNNQVRTAKLLGISRNILRAQLKRFGLLAGGRERLATDDDGFPGEPASRELDEACAG